MNFWNDIEKEYNELSGDAQTGDESSAEFNGLLSDIKKDLKKIPKTEVFPSLSNDAEEEVAPEDESDTDDDDEDGKHSLSSKSKKKKCKVGGKTYSIGERWKDEKTGKNMICILMNVPKNVQPILADAEIISRNTAEAEENSEWTRPSVEPQWSYTATPVPKKSQDNVSSRKKSETPDKTESEPTKENVTKEPCDKTNTTESEKNESHSNETIDNPNKEPEIIIVDPPESKDNEAEKENEEEDEGEESQSEEDSEKNESDTVGKNELNEQDSMKSSEKEKTDEDDIVDKNELNKGSGPDTEIEEEEGRQNEIHNDNQKGIKSEALKMSSDEDHSEVDTKNLDKKEEPQHTNDNPPEKDEEQTQINTKDNSESSNDKSEEPKVNQQSEKGQPIYTKETVVVQRKLIKTEQTIETTETDKTKQ